MDRTACTEPQCLYKGALYLTSVPSQGCSLTLLLKAVGAYGWQPYNLMCRLPEVWELQPPGTLRVCPGLFRNCFTFTVTINSTRHGVNCIYAHNQIAVVSLDIHHQSYLSLQHIRFPLPGWTHRLPYESPVYFTCHSSVYACLQRNKLNPVIYARHVTTIVVFGSIYFLKILAPIYYSDVPPYSEATLWYFPEEFNFLLKYA